MEIPVKFQQSLGLKYTISKGWTYKFSGEDKIELETCPFCKKNNYGHFYMVVDGTNRDGLWTCHRCGKSGNLASLQTDMGDRIPGVSTISRETSQKYNEQLPDIEVCHDALMENSDVLDYLVNYRGFSLDIINKQKLGLAEDIYFKKIGKKCKALVYPYLENGNCTFVHYRSLPPEPKAFTSPQGWDAPLYNQQIIKEGLKEIIFVEGEANTICLLDKGIDYVCGVPGANFKKAMWIDILDQIKPEKIYILYDDDDTGRKAAQTLASRIGVEKCYRISLPEFSIKEGEGNVRKGKDVNEWFTQGGGTKEEFERLKSEATLFDVQGVVSSKGAIDELEEFLTNKISLEPTYKTPWDTVNRMIGFEDGDVIDIVAPEKIGKTTFGMNLMEYAVDKYGEDGIIVCLEMSTMRLARKWVAYVTDFDDSVPTNEEEGKNKLKELREVRLPMAKEKSAGRDGTLYFCYPTIKEVDDAYRLIHDCIRRYGVKWVMFDNIQLLCDRTLKSQGHRTIHLSQISKMTAAIAKDYGIKLIRILQPHRIQQGQLCNTNDVDGASQIAKDCDAMIVLDRLPMGQVSKKEFEQQDILNIESAFEDKMYCNVGLSRYSGGGTVTLHFDGGRSRVSDYMDNVKAQKLIHEAFHPVLQYEERKEKANEQI